MGNIVCKKTSTIVPSGGGMCGKCPVCLGHPGFGHCAYWKKDFEIIKCGVCSSCLGKPGADHCPFWKKNEEESSEIIKCGVCSSCMTPGLGPCTYKKPPKEDSEVVIRCETCSRCNMFQGYGVQCKYWTIYDLKAKEPCNNCSRCGGFPGYGPQCKFWDKLHTRITVQDGDIEEADKYADSVGMDAANRRILHIFKTEGQAAGVSAMFTGDQGQALSYSEMRARYG